MLRRLRNTRWLVLHAGLYVIVGGFMLAVWFLERSRLSAQQQPDFWPGWVMLLLGVPLGIHATIVLARRAHHPETRAYVARRTAQGKTSKEINRCLKRALARRLYKLLEATTHADRIKRLVTT